MYVLVTYYSKFGNTRRIAEAIAETLEEEYRVRLEEVGALVAADLAGAQAIIMGTPTHNMNLPKPLRPLLAAFPRRILRRRYVAAYDTSYRMSWWLTHFTAAKRLAGTLRRLGGKQITKPETFHVTGREGPLYDGEISRAKAWAMGIGEKLAHSGLSEPGRPQVVAESAT